jgi:hypothetical protein
VDNDNEQVENDDGSRNVLGLTKGGRISRIRGMARVKAHNDDSRATGKIS